MDEIRGLQQGLEPAETLFVADSMTGQDAVRSAGDFNEALDRIILGLRRGSLVPSIEEMSARGVFTLVLRSFMHYQPVQ